MKPLLVLALMLLCSTLASAAGVGLYVDATPPETGRAYGLLLTHALADSGVTVGASAALQAAPNRGEASEAAKGESLERLFVLTVAPLDTAKLLVLEELSPADGATVYRASLIAASDTDTARTLTRLVTSVTRRQPVEDGQRVSTVTEAEAQPYSKKPGEFLWGLTVTGGAVAADIDGSVAAYGTRIHFLYEMPHVNFGLSVGFMAHLDTMVSETTARANYLFSEGDHSAFLGGGVGLATVKVNGYEDGVGAGAMITGGVELFRLHSARMIIGAEVLLPLFEVEPSGGGSSDAGETLKEIYPALFTLNVGVLF